MGKKKRERPNRSLDEFFFSKDSISNIHSPKRTQRHRQPVNKLVVGCLYPRARLPITRVCVCLKRMNEQCTAQCFNKYGCAVVDGCSCGCRCDLYPVEAFVAWEQNSDRFECNIYSRKSVCWVRLANYDNQSKE